MPASRSAVNQPSQARALSSSFPLIAAVGVMIGLGIFRTPGEVASAFPSAEAYLAVWIGGGLFVLLNTLVVGELMSLTQRSGGSYALVRRGMGPLPAFLVGWVDWMSWVATIALKAVVFAEFLALLLPATATVQMAVTIAVILFFALLQLLGVQIGARIQTVASIGLLTMVLLSALGLFWIGPQDLAVETLTPLPEPTLAMLGLAVASVVFTYDGWLSGTLFSGEVADGGRAVAIGSLRAVVLTGLLYTALNVALIYVLPMQGIAGSEFPLQVAITQVIGSIGGTIMLVVILAVLLAGINLAFLGSPRILHALSEDGLGVGGAEKMSGLGNPVTAALITAAVSLVMVLFGGFNSLLNMVALLYIMIYAILVSCIVVLRNKEPDTPRAVKAWAYPWSLGVVFLGWIAIGAFIGLAAPETAWVCVGITLVAVPAYRLRNRLAPE